MGQNGCRVSNGGGQVRNISHLAWRSTYVQYLTNLKKVIKFCRTPLNKIEWITIVKLCFDSLSHNSNSLLEYNGQRKNPLENSEIKCLKKF